MLRVNNCHCAILMLLLALFTPNSGNSADPISMLTEPQRQDVDRLMGLALGSPRGEAERSLGKIGDMGVAAVEYATPRIAELLYVPEVIDSKAGFDFVLMAALKLLRGKVKLENRHIIRLKEIEGAGNQDHATFAKVALGFQSTL